MRASTLYRRDRFGVILLQSPDDVDVA